jgi:hypothetical protein
MQNRFTELLAVFESDASNRSIEISGKRRDVVIEALRIAATSQLAPIEHATDNEKKIVGKLVEDLLATPGISLSVNDGEEVTINRSTDAGAIFAALASAGEDYLIVHQLGKVNRWVRLIWGNDVDVISDYHVALEPYMTGANALANELDGGARV